MNGYVFTKGGRASTLLSMATLSPFVLALEVGMIQVQNKECGVWK